MARDKFITTRVTSVTQRIVRGVWRCC